MTDTTKAEEDLKKMRRFCEGVATKAIHLMNDAGAPMPMILDIMFTAAGAQAALIHGSDETAKHLRIMADNVEGGVFRKLTGEADNRH